MDREGPEKLNTYEMRLAAMLIAAPVPFVWLMCFGLFLTEASSKSLFIRPEKQAIQSKTFATDWSNGIYHAIINACTYKSTGINN